MLSSPCLENLWERRRKSLGPDSQNLRPGIEDDRGSVLAKVKRSPLAGFWVISANALPWTLIGNSPGTDKPPGSYREGTLNDAKVPGGAAR